MGDKTHNNAIQLVLRQCGKTSCMFLVARLSVPRHTPQSDTCLSKHVPKAKFLTGRRLDRMASLHTGSKYKLQVRKGMSLFTFSKAALGIEL